MPAKPAAAPGRGGGTYRRRARAASRFVEVRYEQLATDATHELLARRLGVAQADVARALSAAHEQSIGRWRRDLDAAQLADVEDEAGALLAELGYGTGA